MTRRFKSILETAIILIIPIILLLLPADYFDSGESMCLSVRLFSMECYACGLTRACMHLIHFEFVDAYYFNPLAFIVVPLISLICLFRLNKNIRYLLKKT